MPIDIASELPQDQRAAAAAALTEHAVDLPGSMILAIARQVNQLKTEGREIFDLTIGDFRTPHFDVPAPLADRMATAVREGETHYPAPDGIPELKQAVARHYARELGLDYGPEAVCIGSGARPPIYAAWRLFVEPGDRTVSFVPGWNVGYYAYLASSDHHFVPTEPQNRFFPTVVQAAEAMRGARLITLNTPLNPTGTTISRQVMTGIAQALVAENKGRARPCMLLLDQVYWMVRAQGVEHHHPVALVPECAPYVINIDAISKSFAATGLRVGWAVLPPYLQPAMKSLVGHMGSWAPRPAQVATAWFLDHPAELHAFMTEHNRRTEQRLKRLYNGILTIRRRGLPVGIIPPYGAIYLSFRVNLLDHGFHSNEQIRLWLLEHAGLAVVPFQAFDMQEDSGWFRMAVGAISMADIERMLERLESALRGLDLQAS